MKCSHVIDELSGYLDGEARHPEAVAEHLAACAECSAHYASLQRLSEGIRALPVPEVRPEFATRIVARVSEQRAESRPWWARYGLPLAAMACLAVVVGAVAFLNTAKPAAAPRTAQAPVRADSDETLARLDGAAAMEDLGIAGQDEDESVSTEDLLAALSDHEWFDSFASAWGEDEDLDTLIDSLNPEETQTFKELIQQYGMEDAVS